MHDSFFKGFEDERAVSLFVGEQGIETNKFQRCLHEEKQLNIQIESETKRALDLGLSGTPGFAIGKVDSDGRLIVKKLILGSHRLDVFERAINEVAGM
jgi:predicted DsbA family dithiol-disulfide isomerase